MKSVLVAYLSLTGTTEKMAQYIAEGLRMSEQKVTVNKIAAIDNPENLAGYDGYIFGSPTHFSGIPNSMKDFLTMGSKGEFKGKLGGAFGSFLHDGNAPGQIFDTLQYIYGMEPFELGALSLKEIMFDEPARGTQHNEYIAGEVFKEGADGMRACQDYGRVFGERLGK